MANVNMTIRIDSKTKKDADKIFKELGMTTSTAINIFLKQTIINEGFPFEISSKNQMEKLLERMPRIGYRNKNGVLVLPKEEYYKGDDIYDNYKPSSKRKVEHMVGEGNVW